MKRYIVYAVKIAFVAFLFVLMFRPEWIGLDESLFGDVNVVDVLNRLFEVSSSGVAWFALCMLCATVVKLLGIGCNVVRWKLLLRGQGIDMPWIYMTYQVFMGRAIGLLLPGTLGLDGYRLVESSLYTREVEKCTVVIAIEKLIGIIALCLLVFLTFPLGFKYLNINPVVFGGIMAILLGGVVVSFVLLLNPRIIQVMVVVLPLPGKLRAIVHRFGAAATAYSHARGTLLLAVLFGLGVHLSMCFMYFFTFLGIRAENTSITDILFVSPLLITASVVALTISGLGVREVAFGLVLGGTAGHATAILGGHLGLWSGEIIPFLLSIPLLIFGKRPDKEKLQSGMEAVREQSARALDDLPEFPAEVIRDYRSKVFACLGVGALGGLMAGALVGLGEAWWIHRTLDGLTELQAYPWGAAVYGLIFMGVGLGISGGLLFLYLLFDKFLHYTWTFALSIGGAAGAGALIISVFRYGRDILDGHAMGQSDYVKVLAFSAGIGLVVLVLGYLWLRAKRVFLGDRPILIGLAGIGAYVFFIGAGALAAMLLGSEKSAASFSPSQDNDGPNIILVAIDTLRADYLKMYNPDAQPATPHLDAFKQESVFFKKSFAQASWTKPSFATLFTGLYPETHTATSKTSALPEELTTLAEHLRAAGYYTQGFSNNPNVTALFKFDQGFVDYVDLKPSLILGAQLSSSKLSFYEVLRKVRQQIIKRIPGAGISITDFYQPAEVITGTALDWLDEEQPGEAPFYLYLHYMDPHDPFMQHDKPGVGYARATLGTNVDPALLEPMREAYVSEIEYLDAHLGRLFEGLKARGLWDNSLIVFTSDHGEEFFEHGGWWHGFTLYEELVHIPMVLKLPEGLEAGVENMDFARHIDLPPTMMHFAGAPSDPAMPGQTLYDQRVGFTNATIGFNYAHNDFEGNLLHAIREGDAKLIEAAPGAKRVEPVELYDLSEDPGEQNNLAGAGAHGEELKRLRDVLEQFEKVVTENAPEPAKPVEGDEALNEQLEALGYL